MTDIEYRRELNQQVKENPNGGTRRLIGRCAVKGCKSVVTVDAPLLRRVSSGQFARIETYVDPRFVKPAPACSHGSTIYKPVKGRVTDTECGPRCTGATGPNCDCKCGGANHGHGHLVQS